MPATLRSYAKINLGLTIGHARADGFHELRTVYQTVDAWDRVTVSATPASDTSITIRCDSAHVPTDHRNTVWKASTLLLEALGCTARVEIAIEKRLPVQGGLGAGSANAAAAMLGLERELAAAGIASALPPERMLDIAERVGSDVPLFLLGGTSFGHGRGEQVVPLADPAEYACVVAVPRLAVSTPQAFRDWDALTTVPSGPAMGLAMPDDALTRLAAPGRIHELGRKVAAAWAATSSCPSGVVSLRGGLAQDPLLALVQTGIENDFEQVVFPQHPLLRDLRAALSGDAPGISPNDTALVAMLSGSGSSLFGLYASDPAAIAAAARVTALGATALAVRTLSRGRYRQQMFE